MLTIILFGKAAIGQNGLQRPVNGKNHLTTAISVDIMSEL
jgi:hypothetical protein